MTATQEGVWFEQRVITLSDTCFTAEVDVRVENTVFSVNLCLLHFRQQTSPLSELSEKNYLIMTWILILLRESGNCGMT